MQFGDHSPVDCGVFHKNTLALWQERENTVKSTTTIKIMKLGLSILRGSTYLVYCNQLQIKNVTKLSVFFFQSVSLKTILRLNHLLGVYFYKVYYISCYIQFTFLLPLFYPFNFKFSGYDHNSFHRLIFFYNRTGMRIFFLHNAPPCYSHTNKIIYEKNCNTMYF